MNVLSVFDGMSCGQIALKESGIRVDNYFASEIDTHAIKQTTHNFPNTKFLGDARGVDPDNLPKIDLLIGGSPCQGFSFAGKQLNFDDPRSKLFFEFVRIWKSVKEKNPDAKFLLENVNMKQQYRRVISDEMAVEPARINSNLVSAQNRDRFYWTNIRTKLVGLFGDVWADTPQPKDMGVALADILESGLTDRFKAHCLGANYFKGGSIKNYATKGRRQIVFFLQETKGVLFLIRTELRLLVFTTNGPKRVEYCARQLQKTRAVTTQNGGRIIPNTHILETIRRQH